MALKKFKIGHVNPIFYLMLMDLDNNPYGKEYSNKKNSFNQNN